jgi:hypothetical protein
MKKNISAAVAVAVVAPLLSTALSAPSATAAPSGSSAASAGSTEVAPRVCHRREESLTTTKGRAVWLPSALKTAWFGAGYQETVTFSRGRDSATTNGSVDSVGGSGGLSLGVFEASGEYNHEWNSSTTTGTSFGRDYSRTWTWPQGRHRIRVYQLGKEFRATKKMYFTNCPSLSSTWLVRVPIRRNTDLNRLTEFESWKKRNRVKY